MEIIDKKYLKHFICELKFNFSRYIAIFETI